MHRIVRRRFLVRSTGACLAGLTYSSRQLLAKGPWEDMKQAGPFLARADFDLTEKQGLLEDLVKQREELIYTLGIERSAELIELYVLRNETRYRSYLRQQFPQIPYRRALFVKTGGPGMVFAYRHRDLDTDLRHESTHAILHAALPMVPIWLDEGLAEYFEVVREGRAFNHPHLTALRWNLRLGILPSIRDLEGRRDLSEMGAREYRFAWAWAHFMLHGPAPAHEELVRFLNDIERGNPPGLLSERLQRRLPDVEQHLIMHFKNWKRSE